MSYTIDGDRLVADGASAPVPFVASPNIGGGIEPALIVVHFTADHLKPDDTVSWFRNTASKVSAHLVLGRDGSVTQMVEFDKRAWHCDPSQWNGKSHVNGFSIGIEVDNPGRLEIRGSEGVAWFGERFGREEYGLVEHTSDKYGHALWMPFTETQMANLRAIISALLEAYPSIVDIRGHDEICVPARRKNDPGPLMDMESLRALLGDRKPFDPPQVAQVQKRLAELQFWPGDVDGLMGPRTRSALRDFQDINGLPITGQINAATWELLRSDAAKPFPTGGRDHVAAAKPSGGVTGLAKTVAVGLATVTGGAAMQPDAVPPPPLPPEPSGIAPDPTAMLEAIDQAVGHGEQVRTLADRAWSLLDWLQTPRGLTIALTLAASGAIWFAMRHIDFKEIAARMSGQKVGG